MSRTSGVSGRWEGRYLTMLSASRMNVMAMVLKHMFSASPPLQNRGIYRHRGGKQVG